MKMISVECPEQIADALDRMARDGWISSPADAILDAIRRFLDSHRPELTEKQIRSDIDWGLHGDD